MMDLKMKDKKKNQSVPKSLYEQRRIIREGLGLDKYIYINEKAGGSPGRSA